MAGLPEGRGFRYGKNAAVEQGESDAIRRRLLDHKNRLEDIEDITEDATALSVLGVALNADGPVADIVASSNNTVLARASNALAFQQVSTAMIADDAVSDAKLRESAAVSVIGRAANSGGNPADIAAGANDRVLARSSNTLAFQQVSDAMLSSSYALLAGRSGGQTLIGGTGSGENLTLQSTSHGTKGKILMGSSGTELVVDDVNDRVGVGTAGPSHTLDVYQDVASAYAARVFSDGNNANRLGLLIQAGEDTPTSDPSATFVAFLEGDGTATGTITANSAGTVTYNDTSDARLKKDIAPTRVDGLSVVKRLEVSEFRRVKQISSELVDLKGSRYKTDEEHVYALTRAGFIAQQAQAVFPDMVVHGPDGMLMIDRGSLIPVLVKAIQQQQELIEALEGKLAALASR